MSSSTTARFVLKRGSTALFGSSSPQQPRSAILSFSSLIPDPNSSSSSSSSSPSNGKRAFLVDYLALVRRLEAQGVPSKHAEAITEVLNDSLESVAQSLVSKGEMQRNVMTHDASLSKFKSEVPSSLEHHFSLSQRETEKLQGDTEKMRSELRFQIDKIFWCIRDGQAKQNAEIIGLITEFDKEIHAWRAQLAATKYDVIKYCIGTLVPISVVGLAVLRIPM